MQPQPRKLGDQLVSIVLPVFNEHAVLLELNTRVVKSIEAVTGCYEVVYVNDGSSDKSSEVLNRLADENSKVRVIEFSRNFGHQAAIEAGLRYAHGAAVIAMDSDLQDRPEAIAQFIEKWEHGFDAVYAIREKRKEFIGKRFLFFLFYRILNFVSATPVPNDAGIFGCLDRKIVDAILSMPEKDRFLPGMRSWVGFHQTGIKVERDARHDGRPRVSPFQLFQLAKTAIFSSSRVPLSLFYAISMLSLLVCLITVGFTLYHKLFSGLAIPGWTSITIVASFFGAINSLGIGVLGEYVVRIYDQVRGRPSYVVQSSRNIPSDQIGNETNELELDLLRTVTHIQSPSETHKRNRVLPQESSK